MALGAGCSRTWTPGPLPFPTPLCAPLCSGENREPELNLFPSSATVLFPRMSQSPHGQSPLPSGVTILPLPALSSSGMLGAGSSCTWDTQSGLAMPGVPVGTHIVRGAQLP